MKRVCPGLYLILAGIAGVLTGAVAESAEPGLQLISRIDHLDTLAREPMLAVRPDGTLFVTGFGSQVTGTDWTQPPPLWRSEDGGQSWARVDVGASAEGAQGNSDVDLAVGPDGALYFIALGFNRETGEGVQVAMGVSPDRGETWGWQFLSETRFDDRPWVGVAADGTAHAIWNDDNGVSHAVSRDGGKTWREQDRIAAAGGSSHLAVSAEGKVAVRVSAVFASGNRFDAEADAIAVSLDGGESWARHPVPGNVAWDPTFSEPDMVPRWVEPLAWSADGRLHHLWSEGDTVRHGVSADNGANWDIETIAGERGVAFFPYLVSDGKDRLAATWFIRDGTTLTARLAVIDLGASDPGRRVLLSEPFAPLSWTEDADNKAADTAGEYLPIAFLSDGDIAVVSPIQDIHDDRRGFSFWRFAVVE